MNLTGKVLLNENSVVWLEDPGYLGTRAAYIPTGAEIYPVPVNEDGLDLDYAIKNYPKPDLVYTTPSHQYPLGYTMSISRRLQLLEWSKKNKVWIVEDDYDSEYRYAGNPLPSLQGLNSGSGVIYTGTFSKVLFPGLRLGYMVLPNPKVTEIFLAAKSIADRQNAIMEQMITAKFMENGHFTKHIRKMRLLYKERQEILINEINKLPGNKIHIERNDAGMHLIAWLPDGYDDREIKKLAQKRGLIVNSLTEHAMYFPVKPGLILGYTAFNKVSISEGVQRLRDVLHEYET